MPSISLADSAKLTQNELIVGVIRSVVTVDKFYQILPFDGIEGNALAYNREETLGGVATTGIGEDIGATVASGSNQAERLLAKDPTTVTQVTSSLTTIMGDAEVNGLIQATRSKENDQTGVQIAGKAKSAGRKYRNMLINGTGANNQFSGLISLTPNGQKVSAGTDGAAYSLDKVDELMDKVTDKDGTVDYLMYHARTIRAHNALLRALGGASIGDVIQLPSGDEVPAYRGVPMFRNDWIPVNQTQGNGTALTSVFAGTLDDGSRMHGIAGLTAANEAGMGVDSLGWSQTKDEQIWRVKWYCGLALFSELGIAALTGLTN